MNPAFAIKMVRNLRDKAAMGVNRARGREFIPTSPRTLCIETTSLCNLECRFCAYVKKISPKVTMTDEFFERCVAQGTELGYENFDLTPCTGDVFMDRRIFNKLEILDAAPAVQSFGFNTNFTIPDRDDIRRLLRLNKLSHLFISIYGCDADSFKSITLSTDNVYKRMVANLECLLGLLEKRKCFLQISVHPGRRSLRGVQSDITRLLDAFRKAGVEVKVHKGVYNNWGGYVTKDDVRDLPIDVVGPNVIYKNGACVRLMISVQVMATGIVNGCACRDVDATLRIGDLHQTPLRDIISNQNPAYMGLIEEQQRGEFRPVCKSCDFYSSIYRRSSANRADSSKLESLDAFKARLGSDRASAHPAAGSPT